MKKKPHRYVRNHKQPIPAAWENPRYSGACKEKGPCKHCKGDTTSK